MSSVTPIRTKDMVQFHCRLCGNCCRNVKDTLMLEPLDAYHLARCLRQRGELEFIEDVYNRYAHPRQMESGLPIFLLNTAAPDHSCIFLKDGRCSIYEARLKVCRIYPFTIDIGRRGKRFEYFKCMDDHAAHFSDGTVIVKDWLNQNFKREDQEFMTAEAAILPELGKLFRSLGTKGVDEQMFKILFFRYFNFDLDQPFLPQYKRNMEELKNALQKALPR